MNCSAAALLAALFGSVGIALAGRKSAAWEEQINPWNFVPLTREPEMALDIAQLAELEAEMHRHKPGAPVQASDFALGGSRSPSDRRAHSSHEGQEAVDPAEREPTYKPEPYYFRDRATGTIVTSKVSQPADNRSR